MRRVLVTMVCALALAACRGRATADGGAGSVQPEARGDGAAAAVPFEVRADATDLVFFWFDEAGNAHSATSVRDVPEARRQVVRVDPPRPEMRTPGQVYVTDLRAPSPQGTFPVRAVAAEALSQQVLAMGGLQGPLGSQAPAAPPQQPTQAAQAGAPQNGPAAAHGDPAHASVILYGASWCSACHSAAAWMRAHHIAFVEKDIEQDPGAQQEMMAKAQRAGVPTGSIPILDVRGHILVGFSPPDIERALAGS